MIRRLHGTILRALPLPFVAAFATLMFLLLMQFLIRYLPELVGRGLPLMALIELIAYSLAYMVTLAVPMAWLIALLAAFGRLSETRAYLVVKSAGVSLYQLAWPTLLVGAALTLGMAYFNNVMLPDANYRMANLWRDIRVARPGFELEPGVFYTGLDGYAIRAEAIPPDSSGLLHEVTVFDASESRHQTVLLARTGRLATTYGGQRLELVLEAGEVHRRINRDERYERVGFDRYRLAFDLSGMTFERSEDDDDGPRSDRTMRTAAMLAVIDSLERGIDQRLADLRRTLPELGRRDTAAVGVFDPADGGFFNPAFPTEVDDALDTFKNPEADGTAAPDTVRIGTHRAVLDGLDAPERRAVYDLAVQRARALRSEADGAANAVRWERQRADRYRVEVYKKNSIALACLVFVLIGVPLGLAVARGGVGLIATLAVIVFLFYWVSLNQGEKLADRGLLPPWLGMWAANAIVGLLGAFLAVREARTPAGRDPIQALAGLFKRKR